jgi:hypothetical protein
MCRLKTKRAMRSMRRPVTGGLAALVLGTTLAGCSDLYFDRRDAIAPGVGDAIAANEVEQTIDPWPAHSGKINLAEDGQRMQAAAERYRTDKVTPPVDPMAPEAPVAAQNASQSSSTSGGSTTSPINTLVINAAPPTVASQ